MLFYTGLFFLVIAVSLDGLGVGVTYGMQKIRVPILPLLIIMCCSGIIVLLSMTIGTMLSSVISPNITELLGGLVLISIGLFSLVNILRFKYKKRRQEENNTNILTTVLNKPGKADLDKSGTISAKEALLLGAALALDAFGAGLGAAIIGYSALLTASLIAIMSGCFVYCGMKIGILLSQSKQLQKMAYIPPVLLITIGIFNII